MNGLLASARRGSRLTSRGSAPDRERAAAEMPRVPRPGDLAEVPQRVDDRTVLAAGGYLEAVGIRR